MSCLNFKAYCSAVKDQLRLWVESMIKDLALAIRKAIQEIDNTNISKNMVPASPNFNSILFRKAIKGTVNDFLAEIYLPKVIS